ncbi:MAG TPA: hypothetical protein VHK91_08065 [Flavisolibacter sp.]|jgi:hypothetical protein|nr:hypothetical protein [Flavisolibacter sp.]
MKAFICCSILTIHLFSCQAKPRDPLLKAWLYSDEATQQEIAASEALPRPVADRELTADQFLELGENGLYNAYFRKYETGKWKREDKTLILVNERKEVTEWLIVRQEAKKLVLSDKMGRRIYVFEGYPTAFQTARQNPFSIVHNKWRIPATHKETDAELRSRLKNHFSFWETYFQWGLDSKIDLLNVRSTPSLLKLYGNGFQLQYYEYLFTDWKELFYDTADCRAAYERFYYKMYEKKVKWPETENRFQRMVSAFQQLQLWMDEKSSPYARPLTH